MKKLVSAVITLLFLCVTYMSAEAQFQTSDKVAAPRFYKHKVRVNENMQTISAYYAVSTAELSMLNNIPANHKLNPGDIVLIRELKEGEAENVIAEDVKAAPATAAKKEKTVAAVETSTETAEAASAPATAERKVKASSAPRSTATASVSADVLTGPDGTTYQKSETAYHTVEKGQTFYRITKIYGLTANELMSMNNLSTTVLEVGQKLKVSK